MLEVTGPGFGAIRSDLQDMQKMMATLGARLLEEQSGTQETASAVGMRHAGEHATLRTIAQSIEAAVTFAVQVHAWWIGTELTPKDTKATFELNKDFFNMKASPDEVKAAMLLWQSGAISFATLYQRLQVGGWSREGVSAEDELKAIELETPPPPDMTPGEPDPNAQPDPNAPPAQPAAGHQPPKPTPPPPPAPAA